MRRTRGSTLRGSARLVWPSRTIFAWLAGTAISVAGIAAIPAIPAIGDDRSPGEGGLVVSWDMVWPVVLGCIDEEGSGMQLSYLTPGLRDSPPQIRLRPATAEVLVEPLPENSAETRAVQACLDAFTYDWTPYIDRASQAEWRAAHGWASGFAVPCFRKNGVQVGEVKRSDFTADSAMAFAPFIEAMIADPRPASELLEIRRACPPVPPFLASRVRDW